MGWEEVPADVEPKDWEPDEELAQMMAEPHKSRAALICEQASSLLDGDRAKTHGDMHDLYEATAAFWTTFLASKLTEPILDTEVAVMYGLGKIARCNNGTRTNKDNYVDLAGYAGIAFELAEDVGC